MKRICFYILLFAATLPANAQMISNGLYMNRGTHINEFVIVRNDTVQFKQRNRGSIRTYTIGEGTLDREGNIRLFPDFDKKTYALYRQPRSDDSIGIVCLDADSLPVTNSAINIDNMRDPKGIGYFPDKTGRWLLNDSQVDFLFGKNDDRHRVRLGIGITAEITFERGYDYVFRALVPWLSSYWMATGSDWKLLYLNENEISIFNPTHPIAKQNPVKLTKVSDDYPYSDFPFNMDGRP